MQGGAEGEGGQEGRKGEGGEAEGPSEGGKNQTHAEGEEDEEWTDTPSNQTETYLNSYGCQVADNEICCRGLSMSELPVIHNLEASLLDMSGEAPTNVIMTLMLPMRYTFSQAGTRKKTKQKQGDHRLTFVTLKTHVSLVI